MPRLWANVVLSGAVAREQLESNVKSIAFVREPADWPDITESPAEYWARRSVLAWQESHQSPHLRSRLAAPDRETGFGET